MPMGERRQRWIDGILGTEGPMARFIRHGVNECYVDFSPTDPDVVHSAA